MKYLVAELWRLGYNTSWSNMEAKSVWQLVQIHNRNKYLFRRISFLF